MKATYVPERGDLVWIDFDPQAGHEQAGKRPAIVLSDSAYNARIGLCLACPITSKRKGYPFEVNIEGKRISGVILSDQVKNLDWKERNVSFAEKASHPILDTVVENIHLLISSN